MTFAASFKIHGFQFSSVVWKTRPGQLPTPVTATQTGVFVCVLPAGWALTVWLPSIGGAVGLTPVIKHTGHMTGDSLPGVWRWGQAHWTENLRLTETSLVLQALKKVKESLLSPVNMASGDSLQIFNDTKHKTVWTEIKVFVTDRLYTFLYSTYQNNKRSQLKA